MKKWNLGHFAFVLSFVALPALSYAAGLVPCDGPTCQTCDVVKLIQNVINFLIQFVIAVAIIMIAVAGFKMATSGGNPSAWSAAKETLTNVIVGLVILLAAWLIVDTVMKLLVKDGVLLRPWHEIQCVQQPTYSGGGLSIPTTGGLTAVDPSKLVQCSQYNSSCNVSALQAAGFTAQQANVMSCIAMTESSGVASTPPYNTTHPGSNSSACGTFQITKTTWNTAATGKCSDFSNCTNAACNAQVAKVLVSRNGYNDWTCPGCNTKAQGCIDKYSSI